MPNTMELAGKVLDKKMNNSQPTGNYRHCMVVHAYYPLFETRVEREAKALTDQGFEVDVICLKRSDEPQSEKLGGVHVYRLPVKRHKGMGALVQFFEYIIFFVLAFVRLTTLFWHRKHDVIQVHNLPDFLVFVALVPKIMGAHIVLDLHDLMPEFYAERFQSSLNSLPVRLVRWQESLSCRFADQIITVTELWRQALIERNQPADKISVIMNVADDSVFHRAAVSSGQTTNGELRLIYHGVMGRRQGLDLALEAMAMVRATAPEIHLILHGVGEYRNALEDMSHDLGLQEYVEFSKAYLPVEELPTLLMQADLAVVPYRDGIFTGGILPTKLMEYAALGIPAIVAKTPAISEYFDNTMVEFFTPGDAKELADCITKLYQDRDRLEELAQNITRFNDQFSWPVQSTKYVGLVKRLVEGDPVGQRSAIH